MKKSILMAALALGATGAFAQDLTSKKGEPFLPEAGDWSIGVDASPFLDYIGNFFGKSTTNASPTFNFLTTKQTITGRYFLDAKSALRGNLRIGFGGNTERQMVSDRSTSPSVASYPSADPTVENSWKQSNMDIGLALGYEMRRGKTRLQGYYGGEIGFYLSNSKDKFEYGNGLNPVPTGTNPAVDVDTDDSFSGAGNVSATPVSAGQTGALARITERKNGSTFSVGLRGFIGVEYFLFPKISLGGELGWGFGLTTVGKTSTTWESTGNTGTGNDVSGTTTVEGAKQGSFKLDTDNTNSIWGASGAIRLNFYF